MSCGVCLRLAGVQADRRRQRQAADADVGEPRFAVDLDADEEVGPRRREVARLLPAHAGADRHGLEAERLEHEQEEPVLLEAVPAPPLAHELVEERRRVERNRPLEQDVEVLERNRARVRERDGVQHRQRRLTRALVPDAFEVAVQSMLIFNGGGAPPPPRTDADHRHSPRTLIGLLGSGWPQALLSGQCPS